MFNIENKKKQHYVPQFYLNNWVGNDGIWVCNKLDEGRKVYNKKYTKDVGEKNYFYHAFVDDVVYDMLFYKYSKEIESKDPLFQVIFSRLKTLQLIDEVIDKKVGVITDDIDLIKNAENLYDILKNVNLEDWYSIMEGAVSEEIHKFTEINTSIIRTMTPNGSYNALLAFFCFQLFRTPKLLTRLQDELNELFLTRGSECTKLTIEQKNSVIKYIMFIESFTLAKKLHKENYHIRIFKNHTKKRLITSDAPAISLGSGQIFGLLPLTPKLLMQVETENYKTHNDREKIIVEDCFNYDFISTTNSIIDSESHNFLYAKNKNDFTKGKTK